MARECGQCQLCCTLLPTREVPSLAGERCRHQRFRKGCAIYAKRPLPCRFWSCRWLIADDTADLPRPDRAGYVIDIMPDFITLQDHASGTSRRMEVVQVWVDPRRPDAHRDPALRAYLERRAAEGKAALIRFDSERGMVLFAPSLNSTGQWLEHHSSMRETEHSAREVMAMLSGEAS
jgi:hypothetical protein